MPVRYATLLLSVLIVNVASAQENALDSAKDLDRLVNEGMTEVLEARLGRTPSPDEKHLLARAYANQARRARPDQRERAFEQAAAKYQAWIAALDKPVKSAPVPDTVRLAAARVEYAGLLLSGPAAAALDEYEITAGRRGDRAALQRLLNSARAQYEAAAEALAPVLDNLAAHEEELLAAGLYDSLQQTRLDLTLNLGWTDYYLGLLEVKDAGRRSSRLSAAERRFQQLADDDPPGAMLARCLLAVGMAQRELGRFPEAEKNFAAALRDDASPFTIAQLRYELARCQIQSRKYDEARTTLRPLVEKDPDQLTSENAPARLYINLAYLWDANSYLVETATLRSAAKDNRSATAILQKAQRCQDAGLTRMKRLAERGGPWPELVQLYIGDTVDPKAPPKSLATIELLCTASVLIEARKYDAALERLQEASARKETDQNLAAEVHFELARCRHLLKDERGAAETFAKVAAEFRSHALAPQAATYAYHLWGRLAEESGRPDDYGRLADVLRNLLQSFAAHPNRDEASWLLPVALQLARRFDEAAAEFAKIPPPSVHWEEAQYRRVMCGRQALEAARSALDPDEYRAKARRVADALARYADEAHARSARSNVNPWSAQARLTAADLLASPGVDDYRGALTSVAAFETQYPDSNLLGRVLALRIRAYRGLREFDQAAALLAEYLKAASPEHAGNTLASLAQAMQDEVEHLTASGQTDAARALAADALATFTELEQWVQADPSRAQACDAVRFGRAQMLYFAGRPQDAEPMIAALLQKAPRQADYVHLHALVLTARLAADAPTDALQRAQDAWATLLSDATLRKRAPQRYWEARYNWLTLALRLGRNAEVETAIFQESRWYPDLGGPPWNEKLSALYTQAGGKRALTTQPQPGTLNPEATPVR